MKLIHLSDLHLGKRLNEYSLLDDQRYILDAILDVISAEHPDAVLIAGDIYDKTVPPVEAVQLFDDFLVRISESGTQVFVISGNHDSPERIAFGGRLMSESGIHMSPVYDGSVQPISMHDEYGTVDLFMLPFLKPANVRRFFPDEGIESYTDAVRTAISHMEICPEHRNVLITHQFVTGARRSESEEISVGGTDNVDASVFAPFDYTALGHIHSPQNCMLSDCEKVRYCGTPLKYSFSEASDTKSVTVIELGENGSLNIRTVELTPMRDMVELKGTYDALTLKSFYENTTWQEDYTHITLTDEDDIPDAAAKLRTIYHNLMRLDYDNLRTRNSGQFTDAPSDEKRSPLELLEEFYELQNNQKMSDEQTEFVKRIMEDLNEK